MKGEVLYGAMIHKSKQGRRNKLSWLFPGLLLAGLLVTGPLLGATLSVSNPTPQQGGVVRVTVSNPNLCEPNLAFRSRTIPLHKRNGRYRAFLGIDLQSKPGEFDIQLNGRDCQTEEPVSTRQPITVRKGDYRTQHLTIEDEEKVSLSQKALERVRRESPLIDEALSSSSDRKYWYFPFAEPTNNMSPGNSFGSRRVINGKPRSPHSGEDYDAEVGDPIKSIAAGHVSLVGDFFFSGRSVFIDHGHGLHSMYFHLSEVDVEKGDFVQEGQIIGDAGMSGRTTGPHLHLGIKLNGATVDPDQFFFGE